MQNKPGPRRWIDIHVVIASLSLTVMLALWNLFSAGARAENAAAASGPVPTDPLPPTASPPADAVSNPPTPMAPVRILLGGVAPGQLQPQPQVQASAPQPVRKKPKGGGGGGAPAAQTRSS